MPPARQPPYMMIDRPEALDDLCATLRRCGEFGFDTEFVREASYLPNLCLAQVAWADGLALIDPFRVDAAPFWDLVADRALAKVVHAGEQDLEIAYLSTGRAPANVFDVQVAAGLVGLDYPLPYGKLVQQTLRARVPQDQSYSEWRRRPLSPRQIQYALADVQYLLGVRDHLRGRLEHLGRQEWMRQEMADIEREEPYVHDPRQAYRRVRGWQRLHPRELAVLRELAEWREHAARQADLPARTFLADAALRTLAREQPATVKQLQASRGFPTPLARRSGQQVLDALHRGQHLSDDALPPAAPAEDDPQDRMLVDLASAVGQSLCRTGQVSHTLLASRSDYSRLVRALRQDGQAAAGRLRLTTGWRGQFAGSALLDVLSGSRALRVRGLGRQARMELD